METKKLNKKERRKIYLKLAELYLTIKSDKDYITSDLPSKYLCHSLSQTISGSYSADVLNLFPEFALFKPIDDEVVRTQGGGWWESNTYLGEFYIEGFQLRADVMTICAEMCK